MELRQRQGHAPERNASSQALPRRTWHAPPAAGYGAAEHGRCCSCCGSKQRNGDERAEEQAAPCAHAPPSLAMHSERDTLGRAVPGVETINFGPISMPARGGGGQRREGATPPPAGVPDRFKHLPARRVWPQCHPGVAARARGGAGSRPVSQRAGRAFPGARCGLRAALVEAREGPESGQNPSRLVSGGAGGGPVLKLRPGAGRAGGRICTAQGPLPSRTRRLAPRGATVAGGVTPRATDLHGWMRSLSQGTPGPVTPLFQLEN